MNRDTVPFLVFLVVVAGCPAESEPEPSESMDGHGTCDGECGETAEDGDLTTGDTAGGSTEDDALAESDDGGVDGDDDGGVDGDDVCDGSPCVTDCSGQPCGTSCLACPEGDADCAGPEHVGSCSSVGTCELMWGPGQCMNALDPGFEMELTEQGGCFDLRVYARNAEDTVGLVLAITTGVVLEAVEAGVPTTTELQLTDPGVSFSVQTGIAITEAECDDAPRERPVVDQAWGASAGSVVIDLAPDGFGTALADVTLSNVTIERTEPGGVASPIVIPSYTFTGVLVGGSPG